MNNGYPWILGGPWYRSSSLGGPPGRTPRPILQKYASTDFVDRFLKDPQVSLKYVCEDIGDRLCQGEVHAPLAPGDLNEDDRLKLFLDTHSRFYLVVCELHCQAPGYPSTDREQVCEAGFVVRRFSDETSADDHGNIRQLQGRIKKIKARMQKAVTQEKAASPGKERTVRQVMAEAVQKNRNQKTARLQSELQAAEKQLEMAQAVYRVQKIEQRWMASPDLKGVGYWKKVGSASDRKPQVISEQIYPLYPLIPDPAEQDHSAAGKTTWFGVVPTAGAELDRQGFPKFDVESTYAIRCFVRRHQPKCPKRSGRSDCRGELVWSKQTDTYCLADYFDLNGSGHMPINIRLPDINALNSQFLDNPVGTGVNMRMTAPPDSALNFVNSGEMLPAKPTDTQSDSQVCFFAIPLITIVAMFLLRLFLPIVLFIFNLWFLLSFRLCIPPSFSFSFDMGADLQAFGPDFEFEIKAEIAVNGSILLGTNAEAYTSFTDIVAEIENTLRGASSIPDFMEEDLVTELNDNFDATVELLIRMSTDFSGEPGPGLPSGKLPEPSDGIAYFERVSMS